MALIQCPECGKEISDQSEICVHCGYPIAKKMKAVSETNELPVPPTVPEPPAAPAVKQEKKRINKMTLLGVIAAVAVMAVGLFAVLFPKEQSYELPYGIKSDMSIGQMTRQMEDYGFEKKFFDEEGSWYDSQFFKSRNVMGVKTDFSCVEYFYRDSQYKIKIGHFFKEDKQYGGDNYSKNFENILQQLKLKYGEPSKHILGVYWEKGKTKITLEYTRNAPCGEYWLNYMSE